MKLLEAYARLQRLHRPVFATSEATAALDLAPTAMSMALGRLDQDGRVVRLRKGLWALPENLGGWVDLLGVLPILTRPFPSHASLWTALDAHAVIEQIPRATYAVSLDWAGEITTSIGTFRIHRIVSELYGATTGMAASRAGTATAEKALFDTVYLLIARTGHGSLPEIEVPDDFDVQALYSWVDRIASPRWRTLTVRYLTTLGLARPVAALDTIAPQDHVAMVGREAPA